MNDLLKDQSSPLPLFSLYLQLKHLQLGPVQVFTNDLNITRQVLGSLVPNFAVGGHQFGGQLAEIVVFSSTQSAAETETLEGYLACKWGLQGDLPMAHPFKTNCP